MAVIHVSTGLYDIVVVGQGRAHIDGNSSIGYTVENIRGIWKTMKMYCMRIEQVGPNLHSHIGQAEIEFFTFL